MAKVTTLTSVIRTLTLKKNRFSASTGFSLIEIMIVMALIGIFVTFGARRLVNKSSKMKTSVRLFALTIKKLRNRARIENVTYRLVFDLPQGKDAAQRYWVESSSGKQALLMSDEELEERARDLEEDENGVAPDPQGFQPVGKGGPQELPDGLFFESIEIAGVDAPVEYGRAYIFFFPQGYVQESAIHLTDRDTLNWTLIVNPLSGRADIATKNVRLKDVMEQ